jgi:hypothetical protein
MSSLEFEEMDSSGQFAHLMDDSAEKMAWTRSADAYEERAEKLRHLAATLILDAQAFAEDIGTFLAMEFPMTGGEEEEEEADE